MKRKKEVERVLEKKIRIACSEEEIGEKISDDLNLVQSGIYDSIGFLELIASLEDELEIEIDLSEYSPQEFTNYGKLKKIIELQFTEE